VFGTIAAESQRLINETYSTFVRGHAEPGPPGVDVLDGLTTAISSSTGADGREPALHRSYGDRRERDVRILFSRIANRMSARRRRTRQRAEADRDRFDDRRQGAARRRSVREAVYAGGMCRV